MKQRIWELDALRGLCILGMVLVHLVYDLVELTGLVQWQYPPGFLLVKDWGGAVFFVLSGICATLGQHPLRRGAVVLASGLLCTAVTAAGYVLGMGDRSLIIFFGTLHALGCCMLLWPLLGRLSVPWRCLAAIGCIAVGLWLQTTAPAKGIWGIPLGIRYPGFASGDYFPLLPYLGFFLAGSVLGEVVYRDRRSLFPGVLPHCPVLRFLMVMGRWALPIYLLHQPVLLALTGLAALLLSYR